MFSQVKIGTKLTLLLSAIFIGGIVAGGFVLWEVLDKKAQDEISTKSQIIIGTMSSVRSYTAEHIRPLLSNVAQTNTTFIAETIPAFSARTVFERFHRDAAFQDYAYKEATLNPTNMDDKADAHERDLVQRFRQERTLQELSGFRTLAGQRVFYIAKPLIVSSESCLTCHSTPDVAPAAMVAQYGAANGFGWKLNDVVSAQMVYVPADAVFNATMRSFVFVLSIFIGVFAVAILLVNFLLRRYIVRPISIMDTLAQKISDDAITTQDMEAESFVGVTQRRDELGKLASVFHRMAHEVYARTQKLKQQVEDLHIEIDQIRSQKQVKDIVETDFFRDLQAKARKLREQREQQDVEVPAISVEHAD